MGCHWRRNFSADRVREMSRSRTSGGDYRRFDGLVESATMGLMRRDVACNVADGAARRIARFVDSIGPVGLSAAV